VTPDEMERTQMAQKHIRKRLVAEGGCRVEQCSHGNIHVSIGNVTLRMKPAEFKAAAAALDIAAGKLEDSLDDSIPDDTLLC
jgi:hypothetical protein